MSWDCEDCGSELDMLGRIRFSERVEADRRVFTIARRSDPAILRTSQLVAVSGVGLILCVLTFGVLLAQGDLWASAAFVVVPVLIALFVLHARYVIAMDVTHQTVTVMHHGVVIGGRSAPYSAIRDVRRRGDVVEVETDQMLTIYDPDGHVQRALSEAMDGFTAAQEAAPAISAEDQARLAALRSE